MLLLDHYMFIRLRTSSINGGLLTFKEFSMVLKTYHVQRLPILWLILGLVSFYFLSLTTKFLWESFHISQA
jgi:hypothetical protein